MEQDRGAARIAAYWQSLVSKNNDFLVQQYGRAVTHLERERVPEVEIARPQVNPRAITKAELQQLSAYLRQTVGIEMDNWIAELPDTETRLDSVAYLQEQIERLRYAGLHPQRELEQLRELVVFANDAGPA